MRSGGSLSVERAASKKRYFYGKSEGSSNTLEVRSIDSVRSRPLVGMSNRIESGAMSPPSSRNPLRAMLLVQACSKVLPLGAVSRKRAYPPPER